MPSFPTLPTELRQQILHHALTIPLTPPTIPSAIPKASWFYPVEERIYRNAFAHNREIGDYEPALSYNTRGPWGWQHLALLLVSQHFKKDVESVLKRISSNTKPVVDVMVKSDLQISWLVAPPSLGQDLDCVEIRVRCFELFDPDNDGGKNINRALLRSITKRVDCRTMPRSFSYPHRSIPPSHLKTRIQSLQHHAQRWKQSNQTSYSVYNGLHIG